ncbi:MAG TPA: glycine zipper 2TM domain-containing protein [Lysobacter sp.]
MNRNAASALMIAMGLVAASGCATHSTPSTFNRAEVGAARTVEWGTIRGLRDVTIQNDQRTVGTATGAVLGGIAGSTIGSGTRANTAGAVAGAVAGGAAGNAMTRGTRAGVEITVELESGRTIAVTQDGTSQQFRVGDRVQVSSDGTTTRVTR